MPPARARFRYDVFVSYSHHDRDWVSDWLVPQLQSAGLTVCIDYESFDIGAPSVVEMERAVVQSRKTVCVLTQEYLRSEWTGFENILVQTLDPAAHARRLLPILLRPCELPLRLKMLTCVDFSGAEAQGERLRRLIEAIRRRLATPRARATVTTPSLAFAVPTGALPPDSPLYIERSHDQVMRQQVTHAGSTTIIEGARQMGKSSLVARTLAHARWRGCTVIDFDFQELDEQHLDTLETLLRYLAEAIYVQLQLPTSPQEMWQGPLGPKVNLTSFIREYILQGARLAVIMALDEVDRVVGRPYQDDFFALLRVWHNRRARDPLWQKFHLVLAYSTDPRQAIQDLKQSPFNVGRRVLLDDFSFNDMWELNRRYGRPVQRKHHLAALMDVIGGNPYLVQRALYALAEHTHTLRDLLHIDNADVGPFADLLQHYRHLLASEPALLQAMKYVIINGSCPDYGVFVHLRSLGLVTGTSHQAATPRCRLYAEYFQRALP